jgi:iron complex outermembrane receptor protein
MKQCFLWLCCLLMAATGISQTLYITDESTGAPVPFALVKAGKKAASSDLNGHLDLSSWANTDTLFVSAPGYQGKKVDQQTIAAEQYKVKLHRSALQVEEVMVSTHKEDPLRLTSLQLQPVDLSKPDQRGAYDLTQALTREAGVSMLSTGVGISKPVIRGLYGSRLLVLISGLRFDNQQWQDEHGLGLSNFGIDRVEIVKGPVSLLYGTEAVGGVLNIIEEKAPEVGIVQSDVQLQTWSNTGGLFLQGGFKKNLGNKWWRIRVGVNNHADYTDGNGSRVLNSRFNGYYLKSSFGFKKGRWKSDNHYQFSFNNFGFIFNDITHFMEADPRWSRSMSGPHHIVMLNLVSSVNEFRLKNSMLRLNGGFQSNMRTEDEGGGELSLFMHLTTLQYALKWEKELSSRVSLVLANGGSIENNSNYGRRKIVPDAWMGEQTGSVYLRRQSSKLLLEGGAGTGIRYINTLPTKGVNTLDQELRPFTQWRPYWNAMLGLTCFPTKGLNLKANLSTGVRAPNLSELSANGLHEGVYTYELGDPEMTNEQNVNAEAGAFYNSRYVKTGMSIYQNRFQNYIYLKPTTGEWFGFPVSVFTQQDATLTGGEAYLKIIPVPKAGMSAGITYAQVVGVLDDGEYLPFMPARKLVPELRYEATSQSVFNYCFVSMDVVYPQDLVSTNEKTSPSYNLLNAGLGVAWQKNKTRYNLGLSGNNLLNAAYADHLSRIRYFGFNNPGINLSVNFRMTFTGKIKNKISQNN